MPNERVKREDEDAALKDLRGMEYRSVHRDDAVIISGAEYLRKSRALSEAEFIEARIRSEAERETVQRIVEALEQNAPTVYVLAAAGYYAAMKVVREFGGEDKGGESRQ